MMTNHKIKILHIITRLDSGGSSTNTIETVARLDKTKYDVTLISGRTFDPKGDILQNLQVKKIRYVFINNLIRPIHPWHDLIAFLKLIRVINKGKYDIVHTHTSKAGILGRWAARLAGVKHIVHTPHGHIFYGYFNPVVTRIFIIIERWTAAITQKIITLTKRGKEEHIQFKIAPPEKFIPIYSGIDIEELKRKSDDGLDIKKSWGFPLDAVVFGVVARLDPVKGIQYLVEAMVKVIKAFPNSRLLIVGDGTERQAIEDKICGLDLQNHIILTGHREDVAELLQAMDIFVLPSLNEGMGRVILEAMVYAKPVIATRTGGIPELVQDGVNGFLVTPAQSDELADAMIKCAVNPTLARQLGEHGKARVKDMFSLDIMVKKIEQLYNELQDEKK